MIYITEIKPRKISGRTSFLASFNFNQAAIDVLKGLPTSYYHRKDQTWEFPADCLAQALDSLTFIDSIQLTLMPDIPATAKLAPLTQDEIDSFKVKPFQHQIDGINFGLANPQWLLLDNPGCGKTNQVIWLAETLKNRGLISHCLVIAGINSLKSNWKKEIFKFSHEQSIIIGEKKKKDGTVSRTPMSIAERVAQLNSPISEFFVIINVESLRDDRVIKAISSGPNKFGMIAIDEVHKCLATGRSSTQGQNILKLDAEFKVALSGTLIVNNPVNCWGPLYWTGNDHATLTNFKSSYCTFGGFSGNQIVGYKNLETLKDEIESCSLRRTKEQLVDLPPKLITYELLDMEPEHANFYEAVRKGVKEEVDKVKLNASNLLALTTRLRQATACPEMLTTQNIVSTKVERAVELVEELIESGEKVVVLSYFKQPIYKLAELLAKYKPLICTGDQADLDVSVDVDKFQTDDEHMLLLGSLNKVATGLTLNRASYMIMLDEFWTSAMNTQAYDRIYRLNNTTPAFITVLACAGTIDEHVHEVAQFKQELSDFMIDNKPTDRFTDILQDILTRI